MTANPVTSNSFPSCAHDGSPSGAGATPPPVGSPTGGFRFGSPRHRTTAEWRYEQIRAYERLRLDGCTEAVARRQLGVSHATLWRWRRALAVGGFEGLVPRFEFSGRRCAIDLDCVTPAIVAEVQRLTLIHRSASRAWFEFSRTPACPPPLALALKARRTVPGKLLRLARLTEHRVRAWTGQQFLAFEFPNPHAA